MLKGFIFLLGFIFIVGLTSCVTTTIEKDRQAASVFLEPGSTIIVLGRRHNSEYETEPDFIECVAEHLNDGKGDMNVISEKNFVDLLYPWFEPRTAPLHVDGLHKLMRNEMVAETLTHLKPKYIIWVDGSTKTVEKMGSISCGIAIGAPVSCFGFGVWTDDSSYETSIWDFSGRFRMGRISTTARGQSYMPAVMIPIPLIAPVKSSACRGLADHLRVFIRPD
ncbi:MAG: hypothetical protein JKY66_03560 [Spongiibacteraceae bacterium]|nr:hypothetical protein [Spongiibacteraceae bacterium]